MSNTAKDYLDCVLEDDTTPYGGVGFAGETLRDFLQEAELSEDAPMKNVNAYLHQCGIKPIKTKS